MRPFMLPLLTIGAIAGGFMVKSIISQILTLKKGVFYTIVIITFFALSFSLPSWAGDENPLILLPFFILAFMVCYEDAWFARLVTGVIFYTLLFSVNIFFDTLIKFTFLPRPRLDFIILSLSLLKSIVTITICFLIKKLFMKNEKIMLSKRLWFLLGGLILAPFISVVSLTSLGAFGSIKYSHSILTAYQTAFLLPFSLFSSLAILVAMSILSRHEHLAQQEILSNLRESYYENLQREQTRTRTIQHDMRHHLNTVQMMLEQEKKEDALQYLEELSAMSTLTSVKRVCENDIVNAVVANKMESLEKSKIQFETKISLPDNLSISDVDLSSLLSNALDNAVEAAADSAAKEIRLHLRADKGFFMLKVQNSFEGVRLLEGNTYETTKEDKKKHGYGLLSMQDIVKRYDGLLEMLVDNQVFELLISIPLQNHNR